MADLKFLPLLVFQILLIVLYFVFVRFPDDKHEGGEHAKLVGAHNFEDTHVMIFVGFGFLMTFLKRYSYSAVGFNLLLAALVIQWALFMQQLYHMHDMVITVTTRALLEADIMSATVLITFGALLGLTSGLQLMFIAIVEVVIGCANMYLCEQVFKISDLGGSITIHTFGAYFGIAVGCGLQLRKLTVAAKSTSIATSLGVTAPKDEVSAASFNSASYSSDVFAMIGTLFLWIYWPAFNSGLASSQASYDKAVINTYLSLAASTVTTFCMSSILSEHKGKLDMVHVQNATLAGGVAVGAVANVVTSPGAAVLVGTLAGLLSTSGYVYLTPNLARKGILDTCGVNNLHGMPGLLSGILSIIFCFFSNNLGKEKDIVYSAGRSGPQQALYQLYGLIATVAIAVISGLMTGFIAKRKLFKPLKHDDIYQDDQIWVMPA